MQAIWGGGQPDPHRGHPAFRQARGNLDFANMPLSADFSRVLNGPANRNMFADLRPDVDWPVQYQVSYQTIATNIVKQVRERAPTVVVLSTITHNHYAYRDADDAVNLRLRTMLDEMMTACQAAGMKAKGTTLREVVDDVLAHPAVEDPFVCEGAIFDRAGQQAELKRA